MSDAHRSDLLRLETWWTRLEPRPRSDDMTDGLRAAIRDPLWMLSRQWQFHEFRGEDAGSPVQVDLSLDHDALTRVDLRGGGRNVPGPFEYDGGPLEATVERERVMRPADGATTKEVVERDGTTTPDRRLAVEAGLYFLRLLQEEGYTTTDAQGNTTPYTAGDFRANLRVTTPDEPMEAADRRYIELMADRALDGAAIYRAIEEAVDNIAAVVDGSATSWNVVDASKLPLPENEARMAGFDAAVEAYYAWYRDLYDEPASNSGSAWQPTRLEYDFAVSTAAGTDETVLVANEYEGGHLDWPAFSPVDGESLSPDPQQRDLTVRVIGTVVAGDDTTVEVTRRGVPVTNATVTIDGTTIGATDSSGHVTVTVPDEDVVTITAKEDGDETTIDIVPTTQTDKQLVPTSVRFPGMPAPRWWEFEDAAVSLDDIAADGTALPRLLLLEFATQYGNDWFRIPVSAPVGSLSRITDFEVTDSFGVTETVRDVSPADASDSSWSTFMFDLPNHSEPGVFLAPTLSHSLQSDPVERALLSRDEMANLVFGIERLVEGPIGRPVDRSEFTRPQLVIDTVYANDDPNREYVQFANPGDDELDISGFTVEQETDSGSTPIQTFERWGFDPAAVRIDPGTTVTFEWSSVGHDVRVDEQPTGAAWRGHTTTETAGFSFQHTFTTAGVYTFYCGSHRSSGMKGAIVVGDGSDDYGGWFDDVATFDGTVDLRGQSAVTIDVGTREEWTIDSRDTVRLYTGVAELQGFEPSAVRIDPGTTVTFEWSSAGHDVRVDEQPTGAAWRGHTATETAGFSFQHTFTTAGVYTFYCGPHRSSGMKGAIVVGDSSDDYGGWFDDVATFDGTVDLRGQATVMIAVGVQNATPRDVSGGMLTPLWDDADAVTVRDDTRDSDYPNGRTVAKHLLSRPSDARADYRLSTDVPDHWFPFTMELVRGFEPSAVRVDPGTTVTFEWTTDGHDVQVADQPGGATWQGHAATENAGFSFQHTFGVEGIYTFYCGPHRASGMKGAIVVGDDDSAYDGWFDGVASYAGTVDLRGQSTVTIDVGRRTDYRLARSLLLDADTIGVPIENLPQPMGTLLDPDTRLLPPDEDNLRLHEEEVTRSGREVTRRYQLARWLNGSIHLWSGRRTTVGRGETSSGLRFDILEERGDDSG